MSEDISVAVAAVLSELLEAGGVSAGKLVVLGVSTSEVGGRRIGTSGTWSTASAIYAGVEQAISRYGCDVAFQCCEHLNRALVMEREAAQRRGYETASVVPVPGAGGAMAAYAYSQLKEPCVVEAVRADAAIDIGETLIGMHVRPVAVPFRPSIRWIGEARVTAAYARPRLIGGARAVYTREQAEELAQAAQRVAEEKGIQTQDC